MRTRYVLELFQNAQAPEEQDAVGIAVEEALVAK